MLNNIGLPGLLLIVVVTLLLFGRGKVSALMGELGTGLTAFRKGLKEGAGDGTPAPAPQAALAEDAAARDRQA